MQKRFVGLTIVVSAFAVVAANQAHAATYQIGSGKLAGFAQLPALKPGDVVEVDGGASYGAVTLKTDGTADQKITFRGVRVGGKRPVLNGGVNTVDVGASHVVIEGFDITGGSSRCVFHHGNDVTIRDTVIHDCPNHGLLGADAGSGSLLMEYVEIHHCGLGDQKHQVYMATDEAMYPGAVFRMQFCYLHDGNGGHGVKSRAQRNEIYYNWIEGSYYHELELIGPDPGGTDVPEDAFREDSDVVGNVIRKAGKNPGAHTIRIGGDGTGETNGRYRFVNNTIILAPTSGSVFRVFDKVDTIEAYNNVIYREGGGTVEAIRTVEAATPLPMIAGSNNWLPDGTKVPAEWTATKTGTDPAFVAMATKNMHPGSASPLVDGGVLSMPGVTARPFPSPLAAPQFEPPASVALDLGTAVARTTSGAIDIGAYELGGAMPVTPPATTPPPVTTPPVTTPPVTTPPVTTPPVTTPPVTTPPVTTPPVTTPPAPPAPPATTPPTTGTTPPTTGTTPPTTGTTPPAGSTTPVTPPASNPTPTAGGTTPTPSPGTTTPPTTSGNEGLPPGSAPAVTGDQGATGTGAPHVSGSGCSVGSGGASGGIWVLALGAMMLVRRRRRAR